MWQQVQDKIHVGKQISAHMSAKSHSNISLNGILHIMADNTIGCGWDSTNHGRQDRRIWMGLNLFVQTVGLETVYRKR